MRVASASNGNKFPWQDCMFLSFDGSRASKQHSAVPISEMLPKIGAIIVRCLSSCQAPLCRSSVRPRYKQLSSVFPHPSTMLTSPPHKNHHWVNAKRKTAWQRQHRGTVFGQLQSETARNGTAQSEMCQNETAQNEIAKNETAHSETPKSDFAKWDCP